MKDANGFAAASSERKNLNRPILQVPRSDAHQFYELDASREEQPEYRYWQVETRPRNQQDHHQ